MQKNNNRFNRVDEELKKQVSNIIMNDIKDPNLKGLISVTKAKVTPDLKYAKVYVSILNAKDVKKDLTDAIKQSHLVSKEEATPKFLKGVWQAILRLFAPLM